MKNRKENKIFSLSPIRGKRAALEMSVGTIVTIVLLVAMLVLGIFFISKIRSGGTEAINGINQAVQNEINKLFTDDSSKKIVVFPTSRRIMIKKGTDNLGFGFSIRNTLEKETKFSYDITAVETGCESLRLTEAENFIALGKENNNIVLPSGTFMTDPIFVRFSIPDTAPPCDIRYSIQVSENGQAYSPPVYVDLKIKSS